MKTMKESISVPAPKPNTNICVYYENRAVTMKVIDVIGNFVECEFEGVEVCAKLAIVFDGNDWHIRWEAI